MNRAILIAIALFLSAINAEAATLYLKAAGGNCTAAATWSNVNSAGADNSGPPTAADNAIAETGSGNLTIDSGCVMRSFDATSGTGNYAGTVTHTAGVAWTIGDATAGAGNVALKFSPGMAYSLGNESSSSITFQSSSTTQQVIDFSGKPAGNIALASPSNGDYAFTSAVFQGATAVVNHNTGTIHFDGAADNLGLHHTFGSFTSSNTNTRTLKLGSARYDIRGANATVWSTQTTSGLTLDAGTSIIVASGDTVTFHTGTSQTYYDVRLTGSGTATLSGATSTFTNFNRTGTATKLDALTISANSFTVTGTLTLAGNSSTNRLAVASGTVGSQRTITNSGATMTWSNVDLADIGLGTSYDCSAITGGCGDLGGNSNITFTTAQSNYWIGDTGSWSDINEWASTSGGSAGTGRVPLPQDTAVFDNGSFSTTGRVVTNDMPRIAKDITFSAYNEGQTPTLTLSGITGGSSIYGSLTLISGMTFTTTGSAIFFRGRGSHTITMAGKSFVNLVTLTAPNGTYTQSDAFTQSTTNGWTLTNGTWDTNGFNFTTNVMTNTATSTRALNWGASAISQANNTWSFGTTGLTFNPGTSTITFGAVSGTASQTFAGGGATYNNIAFRTGSTGVITISGSNRFREFKVNNPKTIRLTAGTTQTIDSMICNGSSGNLVTYDTTSAGSAASFSKANGILYCDWTSLKDNTATGGATFYAGANSTNVSGNSGWIFANPPQRKILSFN